MIEKENWLREAREIWERKKAEWKKSGSKKSFYEWLTDGIDEKIALDSKEMID